MARFIILIITIFILNTPVLICSQSDMCNQCFTAVLDVLHEVNQEQLIGQALVSENWFEIMEQQCAKSDHFRDLLARLGISIPWLIHGTTQNPINSSLYADKTKGFPIAYKYTSPRFVHLKHNSASQRSKLHDQTLTWKLQYLSFKYGRLGFKSHKSKLGSGLAPFNKFIQQDYVIYTLTQLEIYDPRVLFNIHIYRHSIMVGCPFSSVERNGNSSHSSPLDTIQDVNNITCAYSHKNDKKFLSSANRCKMVFRLDKYTLPSLKRRWCKKVLLENPEGFKLSCNRSEEDISGLMKRKLNPMPSNKGYLYSSLVFIAKKAADNVTSVWGPFTVASWIGILAAYTVTAIVFGVIKIVTMNNLDNSWYDCIINQLLSLMNEERAIRQKELATVSKTVDENENVMENNTDKLNRLYVSGVYTKMRRISVKSLTVPEGSCSVDSRRPSETSFVFRESHSQNGKMSKAILYGTIRIVSFILLALYEGKLYNTITFPKSKLVASFDELISNDKYFIKVSSEAAKFENITDKIHGNLTAVTTMSNQSSRVVESVNIMDCVNWVESGPDPNHACVGYEFELRNLHKAQKSEKILVRSKQKLLRFGSASSRFVSRRRGFTLFPGGFQISKWILESGILQLWSLVENAFMESLINPNWSDPFKVFTIRDYLGLFVVYSLLLILASIMFLLEHSISFGKRLLRKTKVKAMWKALKRHSRRLRQKVSYARCKSICLNAKFRATMKFSKLNGKKYCRSFSSLNRQV
ncbi:unnamed protein product [Orchesella dallaii]|uniref:Uncharacterized protein n=1 Tax=Orchesella dallaii TaxID=48710 RepID=A0ABP1S6X4_9HEXA